MYYKIHPPFCETVESEIEHNQIVAYLAQLDTLLLEFEHSEEFRACSTNYLGTPRIILEDFIHETGLAPEYFDTEALDHGLFVVIPSRVQDLLQDDAHQIVREQISFWAFVSAQWQFKHAQECLNYISSPTLNKLHNIITLGDNSPTKIPEVQIWQSEYQQEQDVYSLKQLTAL